MTALSNLFYKHYKTKNKEWFGEFLIKTKDGNLNELVFLVKRLVESGSWVDFYNFYFQTKIIEIIESFISLLKYYELSNGNIDMQLLLDKQLSYFSDLKEIEENITDVLTVLYFASEIGYLYIKATGINKNMVNIPVYLEHMSELIELKTDSDRISDKSYTFHSLHLSEYSNLSHRLIKHINDLRISVPFGSFNYELKADELIWSSKLKNLLVHKKVFSFGVISLYVKDKLFERHNHLTNKQYLDLKTSLSHPFINSLFTFLHNLKMNRIEIYNMFHIACEKVFNSIHQKINEIYSQSGTDKELNKELANYCWVSFNYIYDLQVQIDNLNQTVSLTTVISELNTIKNRKNINKPKTVEFTTMVNYFIEFDLTELQKLISLYADFDTHKHFLSKRLFECFQRHLTSTSSDKKLLFLKFFGAADMRSRFKNILAYLTDRKIENLVFGIIALLSYKNIEKAKALLEKKLDSVEDLKTELETYGLHQYHKYI